MKTYRILALICLAVILLITVYMIASLAQGSSQRFFIGGGVWTAAVIVSFVLVRAFKNRSRKEETDDRASEN